MVANVLVKVLLTASLAIAGPLYRRDAEVLEERQAPPNHNDFTCRSATHPNPVIIMHGLGATYYEDLNYLESYLKTQKFCTFSITYGDYAGFPYVGGLDYINASSLELATFVREVQTKTGAAKVDFVGHSEGAFQALYVPKFTGVANMVQRVIAIAPPTHGTTFGNLYTLSFLAGSLTNSLVNAALAGFGCRACTDLVTNGAAVNRLNTGPIAQPGIKYTIITSKYDGLVTPVETAFVKEPGVENLFVQDYCPLDPVGHIGEAYDLNVWRIVQNRLSDLKTGPSPTGPDFCVYGSPGK